MNSSQGLRPVVVLTAVVCALIGLYLLAGGVWLTALGGSAYYVVAGLMLLVTAGLLFRRRQEALWVYAALLIGTMIWAVAEVGFDFWALAPRGDILVPLGVWLLL
ncbi:LPXTG cell wall anchor domain-containing protein, partial [Gluconacetobacter azotocaptans]